MGFGIRLVDGKEEPVLMCDVCGEKVGNWSNAKAVGQKPSVPGEVKTITFCHNDCSSAEPNAVSLREFLGLYTYLRGGCTKFAKEGPNDTFQMTVPKVIHML